MRLIDLLNALKRELDTARQSDSSEKGLEVNHAILSKRFDELGKYKIGDDMPVVGIELNEIKSVLKSIKNTFYSVHSGLLDEEINRGTYNRQLAIAAMRVGEIAEKASTAYLKSTMINFTNKLPPTIESKSAEVTAASDPVKTYKLLVDVQKDLKEAKHDTEEAGKISFGTDIEDPLYVKYLRETQSAPSTPEGYRELQDKNKIDHDPKDAEKDSKLGLRSITQDESQKLILENYQPALQRLAAEKTPSNLSWTIARGPVFFMSTPPLRELAIKGLKVRYDAFFPGWILADQYLLGIKSSMMKDRREFLHTLRHIREAFGQRFYTPFVYVTLPSVNLNRKDPILKNQLSDQEQDKLRTADSKTFNKKQKSMQRKLETQRTKEDASVEIPRFKPLPGSSLLWTWLMPENKYNSLPRVKISDFGFPVASNMRSMEDRMSKRILPELKDDQNKRNEIFKDYNRKVEKLYDEQSKPLKEKVKEIEAKILAEEATIEDFKQHYVRLQTSLKESQHSLALTSVGALRDKLKQEIQHQEDQLAVVEGQMNGHAMIAKALAKESKSIKAQMVAMASRIRQEVMTAMKAIDSGKYPEDPT